MIKTCDGCGTVYDEEIAAEGTYVSDQGVSKGVNPHAPCPHAACANACTKGCGPTIVEA